MHGLSLSFDPIAVYSWSCLHQTSFSLFSLCLNESSIWNWWAYMATTELLLICRLGTLNSVYSPLQVSQVNISELTQFMDYHSEDSAVHVCYLLVSHTPNVCLSTCFCWCYQQPLSLCYREYRLFLPTSELIVVVMSNLVCTGSPEPIIDRAFVMLRYHKGVWYCKQIYKNIPISILLQSDPQG